MLAPMHKLDIYDLLNLNKFIATYACLAGMRTPIPDWFKRFPIVFRAAWRIFVVLAEASLSLMLTSCGVLLFTTDNIVLICEKCADLMLLFSTQSKTIVLVKYQKIVDAAFESLHDVGKELRDNPIGDSEYLNYHNKKLNGVRAYSSARFFLTLLSFLAVNWSALIPGILWPSETSPFPMEGWYPIDRSNLLQFVPVSVSILIQFSLCGARDIYVDMVLHILLATLSVQIKYLGLLLSGIVKSKKSNKRKLLHWWIKKHQHLIKIMDDLKPFTDAEFFIAHACNAAILLCDLIRATEDKNFNVTRLATIMGVSSLMLMHLYIACTNGDDIEKNMRDISDAIEDMELWDMNPEDRVYLMVVSIFSTKPYAIQFGKGVFSLRTEPYGGIVVNMLGYFNTIYQLRQGN